MNSKEDSIRQSTVFPYKEVYFLGLKSQSNVYCCTKLNQGQSLKDGDKLIVGSLRGTVTCICCSPDHDSRNQNIFTSSEIYFTYIPGDAEIISMDSFSRIPGSKNDSIVIAISLILVKVVEGAKKYQHFLNIYKAMDPEQRGSLCDIARSCQHIELYFVPYQLTHTRKFVNPAWFQTQLRNLDIEPSHVYTGSHCREQVLLLSGSDKKVHLFKENEEMQRFEEYPTEETFPEFSNLPSSVIWMEVKHCCNGVRMTAFGCENGFAKVAAVEADSASVLKSYTVDIGGLVTSVHLFPINAAPLSGEGAMSKENETLPKCEELCLLVTCAMELSAVYLNVYHHGFDEMVVLPQSDHFDSVSCSAVADFDLDGHLEILLGTYGQELLVYKAYHSTGHSECISVHFDLKYRRSFPRPIFAMKMVDFMVNGVKELAVVSLNGIHILQLDVNKAADAIIQRIFNSHDQKDSDDEDQKAAQDDLISSPS